MKSNDLTPDGQSGQLSTPASDLSGSSGGGLRHSRFLSKEIARAQGTGLIRATKIGIESTMEQVKLSAASSIGRRAQSEPAVLTQMEAELTKAVPLAGNRLEMIGNITTVQVGEMVPDALSRLRRV